jgi:flagellar motor switch protein FliN/FliY
LASPHSVWLTNEWVAKLVSSVEMMTETKPGMELGSPFAAGGPEAPANALWVSLSLDVAEDAAVFVGAGEASWVNIGKSALAAAGVPDATPEDARGTYLEIVTQATSGLAQAIAAKLGKPVASSSAKEVKLSERGFEAATSVTPIEIVLREFPIGTLFLGWSAGLERGLTPQLEPARPKSHEHEAPEAAAVPGDTPKSRTFDLLMEVELPVSVSFGRSHLPLRDMLKLTSGSIVELNRTISDPVEVIVNNCVIARGEVVVVEGNYGVRILHVISREERLRTLK